MNKIPRSIRFFQDNKGRSLPYICGIIWHLLELALSIFCVFGTYKFLHAKKNVLSKQTYRILLRLINALVLETTCLIVFLFIPLCVVQALDNLFHVPLSQSFYLIDQRLCSAFLPASYLITIFYIVPYRRAVNRYIAYLLGKERVFRIDRVAQIKGPITIFWYFYAKSYNFLNKFEVYIVMLLYKF